MKAMARQRSHSIEFKRQVAQEFIAGESLYALSKRHDISRQLIRVWVQKYEAGALDEDAQAADLLQEYEAKIAALERMVGRQALEIEYRADRGDAHPFIDRARPWREGHRGVVLVALLRHERGATLPHGRDHSRLFSLMLDRAS